MVHSRKPRVLFHSNYCKLHTGLAKNARLILSYLYQTGKYDLFHLCNGFSWSDPQLKSLPWPAYGSLPDDQNIVRDLEQDILSSPISNEKKNHDVGSLRQDVGYGSLMVEKAIEELKIDIYIGSEDAWAFHDYHLKPFWKKINTVLHVTCDSLPIFPACKEQAPLTSKYLVWATFAEKELKKMGCPAVETMHGAIDHKNLFRLSDEERAALRKRFKLEGTFIAGFVFRNQPRKSVDVLLDAFKAFSDKHENARLLLHTHWAEGWNLPQLIKNKGVDNNKVYTTYVCRKCSNFHVQNFIGQNIKCNYCKDPEGCETSNIRVGVSEKDLNKIYNLLDVLAHPVSSGGQELPLQESKLTELITLCTSYSCGLDACSEEAAGLPLDWTPFVEIHSSFEKAATKPESILEKLEFVYNLPKDKKREMEKKARQYVLNNYTVDSLGPKYEKILDNMSLVDWEEGQNKEVLESDPFFTPDSNLEDKEWVESLYANLLKQNDPSGVEQWLLRLKTDCKREDVLLYFRKTAIASNQKLYFNKLLAAVKEDQNQKRIAFVVPEGEEEVISSTALLESAAKLYPDYNIYYFTQPQYFDFINGNPYVYKTMHYFNKMNDPLFFEGQSDKEKIFELVYMPQFPYLQGSGTDLVVRNANFMRNSKDKIEYDLYNSDCGAANAPTSSDFNKNGILAPQDNKKGLNVILGDCGN